MVIMKLVGEISSRFKKFVVCEELWLIRARIERTQDLDITSLAALMGRPKILCWLAFGDQEALRRDLFAIQKVEHQ